MRKILVLALSVISVGCLTGCGSKEKVLDCSMDQTQSGIDMTQNIKATFKGNNVKNLTVSVNAKLGEEYQSYKSVYVKALESTFASYKELKGVDITTEETDEGAKVVLKADITKMDDEAKDKLDIVNTKGNYDKTKKEIEKEGYTCK